MNFGFWRKIKEPIVGLAPMDGVTDAAMRFITKKYGNPDVMFTEFTSAEGVMAGAERVLRDFKYDESERPIVAQVFGRTPEAFLVTSKKVLEMGFDGIDINMGCPSKNVTDNGAGAGLIENQKLAEEIIKMVREGVEDKIPVSVKTRIGTREADPKWWEFLAGQGLAAVTMHGRTYKQMYQGKADWDALAAAGKIVKSGKTLFLGNGDVETRKMAVIICAKLKIDGVLIGRAAMGNPWVFKNEQVSIEEKLNVAIEHAQKYEELYPGESFLPMRKHLAHYVKGFEGASDLRQKMVLTNSANEARRLVENTGTAL